MMGRKTSIFLSEDMESQIRTRGDRLNTVIHRDLERLYTMYELSLSRINLTPGEACLIVDSLKNITFDTHSAMLIWAQVDISVSNNGLAEKWQVNGYELVEKLRLLSLTESLAIVDAVERFWQDKPDGSIQERVKRIFGIKEC